VAYLLKERAMQPEKQALLVNGSETTFVSRQWGKTGNRTASIASQQILNK
jgi:hypothetical protein